MQRHRDVLEELENSEIERVSYRQGYLRALRDIVTADVFGEIQ